MKRNKWIPLAGFLLLLFIQLHGQAPVYNFRHVTTSDGLSNATIRGIAQDKYGYIWIGSTSGLSRYNGYDVKVFIHSAKDSFSIPDNLVFGVWADAGGNVWIRFSGGLYRYEYSSGHFILQKSTRGIFIYKILQKDKNVFYLATSHGLALFNAAKDSLNYLCKNVSGLSKILLSRNTIDLAPDKKEGLYIITDTGLVSFHPKNEVAELITIPAFAQHGIEKVTVDNENNTWISYGKNGGNILRIRNGLASTVEFEEIPNNHINDFFCDSHHRLWVSTSEHGLANYDPATGSFNYFVNSPFQQQSISANNLNDIFEDSNGFIWIGSEGSGINYFQPDNNLFQTILPGYQKDIPFVNEWSRAVAEDKNSGLWLGTVNGVALFNAAGSSSHILQNRKNNPQKIYSNSVRALLYDDHDLLWIGTARGLNRYNSATGQMDFFDGKNALPQSFYKSILQDHDKNIWIGCRDGLYRFDYLTNTFFHFDNDPLFASLRNDNIQTIFEDSRHRMWFGTYGNGAILYDPEKKTIKSMRPGYHDFIGNNIRSFAEDHHGTTWIAGSNGLASIDYAGNFKVYNEEQGLASVNTAALLMDKHDRLWIGTGKGLYMLDSLRQHFTFFSIKDGLTVLELNDQEAIQTRAGDFIYPTLKGFLVFNPENYKKNTFKTDVFISDCKVFNKPFPIPVEPENLHDLKLRYDQNFFSFQLTGINYANPEHIRYAYKLEPFDKGWTYTKDRIINYTNVPGGNYTLHYKATATDDWNTTDKIVSIHVGQVFYKSAWFFLAIVIIVAAILYSIYKYRVNQKEKIFFLQGKTHLLEKEKAIVQYESLKQQLNPHFLFNSLTSLRSLIRINKEDAAGYLDKLSANYRYILKSSDSELVSLKDELQFAQTYIDMQQVRFGNGLEAMITIGDDYMHKKIVPVTIQNLIENAIKHNLIDPDTPLKIDIFEAQDYLVVQNNFQLKEFVETSNKYGLKNLQSLYKYLDDRPVVIETSDNLFIVKIPLI